VQRDAPSTVKRAKRGEDVTAPDDAMQQVWGVFVLPRGFFSFSVFRAGQGSGPRLGMQSWLTWRMDHGYQYQEARAYLPHVTDPGLDAREFRSCPDCKTRTFAWVCSQLPRAWDAYQDLRVDAPLDPT
jgi:hypothetical protein